MTRSIRLLVADNEADVVETISGQIRLICGERNRVFEICPALSGTDVIEIIKTQTFDSMILDYDFGGGMNGEEIIEHISDPFQQCLIFILSGQDEHRLTPVITRLASRFGNRFRFLRKPIENIELRATLNAIKIFVEERPVAYPFSYFIRKTNSGSSGLNRFWSLINLLENFLKYSVGIMLGDFTSDGGLKTFQTPISLDKELTFGSWIRWTEELANEYIKRSVVSVLPLKDLLSQKELFGLIWRFHTHRNELAAHGFSVEDDWYCELLSTEESQLTKFVTDLRALSNNTLFVPDKVTLLEAELHDLEYQVRVLMGSSEQFDVRKLRTNQRLQLHKIYSYSGEGRPSTPLDPFIVFKLCKECKSKKIFFLDRLRPSDFVYKSFCNHVLIVEGGLDLLMVHFPWLAS